MESTYFINNMGSFFLALLFDILMIIVWLVIRPFNQTCKCCKKANNKLSQKLFWNSWIVTITQSFMNVALCTLIAFKYKFVLGEGEWGEQIQSAFCLFFTAIYLAIPFGCLVIVMRKFESLENMHYQRRFGAFYEGLKLKNGRKVLIEPTLYLLRRLALALLVVLASISQHNKESSSTDDQSATQEDNFPDWVNDIIFQIYIVFGLSLIVLLNPIVNESHLHLHERRSQTLAELLFIFTASMFVIFRMLKVEDNFTVGYVPIVVFGVYLFLSFAVIFKNMFSNLHNSCRMYKLRRAYKKSRVKLQERLLQNKSKTK